MRMSRHLAVTAVGGALAVGLSVAAVPPASAAESGAVRAAATHHHAVGTKPLAQVLFADTSGFDRNGKDFDILAAAVKAVLKAKPHSAVGVLANGKVRLTAFLPDDAAFRELVRSLTGKNLRSEQAVFTAVAGLGIPTVEKVLLYHVVPGATITAKQAARSNGVWLRTAEGAHIKVRVVGGSIFLQDKDPNARNPRVIVADINKGNRQIAHVIDRVLRPVDLPPLAHH